MAKVKRDAVIVANFRREISLQTRAVSSNKTYSRKKLKKIRSCEDSLFCELA